jgi:LDH2 family malate/lactate/ureidoglycolate dehydrogenase
MVMGDTTRIGVTELGHLGGAVLEAAGLSPEDAADSTRILVEADMLGLATHGVVRLPSYVARMASGGIDSRANLRIEQRTPSVALVDGANGVGTVVGARGLRKAMEMVADAGIAYVGCKSSNHFGALAPYALEACEAGYVMVAGTNASTTMPPWGGAEARIGNNPLAVAAPIPDGPHFILDMAMSVAARGKIRAALRNGVAIPDGWAVDAQGRPTTEPGEALAGFLLPFGGYKGSGLSMAVDILCGALTGAGFLTGISSWSDNPDEPQRLGHFFLLLDPAKTVGRDAFAAAMTRFRDILLATPSADPDEPVRLPGQLEQERRREALASGVAIPDDLLGELETLAGGRS